MADTKTQIKNPFAQALANSQETGSQLNGDESAVISEEQQDPDLTTQLFKNALQKNNDNKDASVDEEQTQLEEDQRRLGLNQERHDLLNPTQENEVEIFARKQRQETKDARDLNALQQQFVEMAQAKQMPVTQQPEILKARIVDPGERGNVFNSLMVAAKRSIEMFVPQPPHVIAKGRQARREGLVANADQDRVEQMKLQHEFNVNGGA